MQALALEAIQGMTGGLLWLALLHALWIGLAAAGGVALAFQAGRPFAHRARHAGLLAALGLVAVGPPALSALQYLADVRRPEHIPIGAEETFVGSTPPLGVERTTAGDVSPTARFEEVSTSATLGRRLNHGLDRLIRIIEAARPFGLIVWSLTVAGLAAVLAFGARGLSRLRREARPAPPLARRRARRLARLLRLRNAPAIRVHPALAEPCLCGVFRPVVLLPARWLASASVGSLDAVLAHELAHAKRFDHLVNLAQRGLEILLFFHPGVHWLSRSLRRQAEHCADALAVRLTGDPLALARTLESMARFRADASTSRPLGAAFGGESTSLLPRIQELIGMTPTRPRKQVWPFAALPAAAAVALVAASIGFAEDQPPESVAPRPSSKSSQAADSPTPPAADGARKYDYDPRQIAYDVRYIDTADQPWRSRLEGRFTPVQSKNETRGWLIDDEARASLLKLVMADPRTNVLQPPKVTTFQDDLATIILGLGIAGVNSFNAHEVEFREKLPRSSIRDAEGRSQIELGGRFSPRGVNMFIDLSDSMSGELGEAPREDRKTGDSDLRPSSHEARYKTTCEVPTNTSLLISLGRRRRQLGSLSMGSERLVLVKPLRIVVDPDGQPRVDPPNAH